MALADPAALLRLFESLKKDLEAELPKGDTPRMREILDGMGFVTTMLGEERTKREKVEAYLDQLPEWARPIPPSS